MKPDLTLDIAALAEELCDPRQHVEPIYEWDRNRHRKKVAEHRTTRPGLLVELHNAIVPLLSALNESGARGVPRSTPPLQLEALDRYLDIEVRAGSWVSDVGLGVRLYPAANIRALVGVAPKLGDRAGDLLADLRRWRGWAATMCGWQSIYRPRAACPVADCAQAGTLRVNLLTETAICVACRAWWDRETIGLLAEHIKQEEPKARVRIGSGTAGHGGWSSRHAATT